MQPSSSPVPRRRTELVPSRAAPAARARGPGWVGLLGCLAVCLAVWLGLSPTSSARLEPYYVLRNPIGSEHTPRVLLVVDTSENMAAYLGPDTDLDGDPERADCAWSQCEQEGATQESRISQVRRALRQVVEGTEGQVDWSLMTFDQLPPPTSPPNPCGTDRFVWGELYRSVPALGFQPVNLYAEVAGHWKICSGSVLRPYPYLRWDGLGVGSVITADDQTGPVPPSPLISTAAGDIDAPANATRRVQWFPRFMGVRANLNATTDPGQQILNATYGDFTDRGTQVWGHDFYYWPYVDGFPGYAAHQVTPGPGGDHHGRGGVVSEGTSTWDLATLYAPFYVDFEGTAVPIQNHGPSSRAAAQAEVLAHLAPLVEGGLDVAGPGRPWSTVIGDVPGAAMQDNRGYSHRSVASYLHFLKNVPSDGVCRPTTAILVASAPPTIGSGGDALFQRLAELRDGLGVSVYTVGYQIPDVDLQDMNGMACAAAGACDGVCATPCDDTPAASWDTCDDPESPATSCAFFADTPEALASALQRVVERTIEAEVPTGPPSAVNEFSVFEDGDALQTGLRAWTEAPGWRGHVSRSCTELRDAEGDLEADCADGSGHEFTSEQLEETFGPCPQSRSWDAGECLQLTPWQQRRIYSHRADGTVYAITDASGESASTTFRDELESLGVISGSDLQGQADALARFIKGESWPDDWKLPGLAGSNPVVVRRIPRPDTTQLPAVNIRDPHCAGRRILEVDASGEFLPESLIDFAQAANDEEGALDSPSPHAEYQEAVLVGDDLGVLHAFQFNSGNELWGFVPRVLLANTEAQRQNGVANRGQPTRLRDHVYGVGGTANEGYAYDAEDERWRHLAIFGLAAGGAEYIALDVSHMSPSSTRGPVEVLWTSEDSTLKSAYDPLLGETWARPALSYRAPRANVEPETLVLLGSGYRVDTTEAAQGRSLMLANAITGELEESVRLPAIDEDRPPFEPDYAATTDPAIVSHCVSKYWSEIQEVYVPDPAGRLFRWDLGGGEQDSGNDWSTTGVATPVTTFRACEAPSEGECWIDHRSHSDPFIFGAAVTANDRLDDSSAFTDPVDAENEEVLIALISGSTNDETLDGRIPGNELHSSLYLLVDDHHTTDAHLGFNPHVYINQPKLQMAEFGNYDGYMRMSMSDITRTRVFRPYPGATEIEETREFLRTTRPIRAPRIKVTGVRDTSGTEPQVIEGLEAYTVSFWVYEPPEEVCDSRFQDTATGQWYPDRGETYEITLQLFATSAHGFDFGFGNNAQRRDEFDLGAGELVQLVSVEQVEPSGCPDGNCGLTVERRPNRSCQAEPVDANSAPPQNSAVPVMTRPIQSFTPIE